MQKFLKLTGAALIIGATTTLAQADAENPAVQARMDAMKVLAQNLGVVGKMAKGEMDFDADAAQAAIDVIAEQSNQIPALFEAEETDPKSKAKPIIWTDWDAFVAQATALTEAAQGVDASSVEGLGQGLGAMGGVCASCHKEFRS